MKKIRDCANCKHYVVTDSKTNWNSQETTYIKGCELWECEFEPTTKNYLSEEDILELKHRYGDEVEFVVRDMLTGEDKRWDKLPSIEPTTKNDLGVDAISRSDVLKLMQDNWHTHNGDWAMQESLDDIRALPSVTPQEPKTGHWIDDTRLGYHVSVCSNCNWRGHGDTCLIYKPKYCPNCGAKMVEPQERSGEE